MNFRRKGEGGGKNKETSNSRTLCAPVEMPTIMISMGSRAVPISSEFERMKRETNRKSGKRRSSLVISYGA